MGVVTAETPAKIILPPLLSYIVVPILFLLMLKILLSNAVVIILFMRDGNLRVPTNYFVWCLCTCDFCQGLSMPIIMVVFINPDLLQSTKWWCISSFMLISLIMCLSFYLQLGIAFDRLLAIAKPLHYTRLMTTTRSVIASLGILFYSIFISIVLPFIWFNPDAVCTNDNFVDVAYMLYVYFPNLTLCLFLLTVCYARMFVIARSVQRRQPAVVFTVVVPGTRTAEKLENEMKAAKTFLIVIGINAITYIPASVAFFLMAFLPMSQEMMWFCQVLGMMPFIHAAINPWVYAMRLQTFRTSITRLRKRWHDTRKIGVQKQQHRSSNGTNNSVGPISVS